MPDPCVQTGVWEGFSGWSIRTLRIQAYIFFVVQLGQKTRQFVYPIRVHDAPLPLREHSFP